MFGEVRSVLLGRRLLLVSREVQRLGIPSGDLGRDRLEERDDLIGGIGVLAGELDPELARIRNQGRREDHGSENRLLSRPVQGPRVELGSRQAAQRIEVLRREVVVELKLAAVLEVDPAGVAAEDRELGPARAGEGIYQKRVVGEGDGALPRRVGRDRARPVGRGHPRAEGGEKSKKKERGRWVSWHVRFHQDGPWIIVFCCLPRLPGQAGETAAPKLSSKARTRDRPGSSTRCECEACDLGAEQGFGRRVTSAL